MAPTTSTRWGVERPLQGKAVEQGNDLGRHVGRTQIASNVASGLSLRHALGQLRGRAPVALGESRVRRVLGIDAFCHQHRVQRGERRLLLDVLAHLGAEEIHKREARMALREPCQVLGVALGRRIALRAKPVAELLPPSL